MKKFATIKDYRIDDGSLLLQQYEAQINSCLKIIFANAFSLNCLFKGLKILYQFISIPITTDTQYIRKVASFVDISLKPVNSLTPFYSEKFDHILVLKKLNFFCYLYFSTIKVKMIPNISVLHSEMKTLSIYHENINKTLTESLAEFFKPL